MGWLTFSLVSGWANHKITIFLQIRRPQCINLQQGTSLKEEKQRTEQELQPISKLSCLVQARMLQYTTNNNHFKKSLQMNR